LRNCIEIFEKKIYFFFKFSGNFSEEFLEEIFWRNFFGGIFWRIFLGGLFGGFFGRNSLFTLELTCLSRFWFLSRFCLNGEGRKEEEGQEFRSLEVRRQAHRT
jgi:hypothetical protein